MLHHQTNALNLTFAKQLVAKITHRTRRFQIGGRKQFPDSSSVHFAAMLVGLFLHFGGELDLQAARHDDTVFVFQQIGDAALAGLAVDADHRVVAAPQIGRIDRQIGHVPQGFRLLHGKALLDRVLVRAGKGGEYQISDIGVARVDRQLRAVLVAAGDGVDVGKVELRIDALRIKIERQRDEVDVTGTFAVAKEAALDPVATGHQAQFGRGHGGTAIVVRVQADQATVTAGQMAMHPLDLVGINVGRGHFDGGRQVEDDLVLRRRAPGFGDGVADLQGKIKLGGGEIFRAVLEHPFGCWIFFAELTHQLDRRNGHFHHFGTTEAENDFAERL